MIYKYIHGSPNSLIRYEIIYIVVAHIISTIAHQINKIPSVDNLIAILCNMECSRPRSTHACIECNVAYLSGQYKN